MSLAWLLNTAWMLKCRTEWRAFRRAVRSPEIAQARVLSRILHANRETEFGRNHGFCEISTPQEFARRVPLSDYEDFAPAIERIAAGEANVLTAEPVRLLEPTSGRTAGRKLIPYTRFLEREFQRMIAAWVYNLFRGRPAVRRGPAYWSISPALQQRQRTRGGIPIGFDDDTAYLGGIERRLMRRLLAAPPELAGLTNIDDFRYATLLSLLRAEDLSLVSVWSPTFLTALLERLDDWGERLCRDLRAGQIGLPSGNDGEAIRLLRRQGRPDRRRAAQVRDLLQVAAASSRQTAVAGSHRYSALPTAERLQRLWPRLKLISCWTDASANAYAGELSRLLPGVEIQPKGLLATEGCVSFPLVDRRGAALALRSHFYEFEPVDGGQHAESPHECRLAHELEIGGRYGVVLTTGGGLYRYRLRDVVEVVGFEQRCPLLVFCGRSDDVCDMVGEKLSERHVRAVLERALAAMELAPRFFLVVPVPDRPPHYRLYLQLPAPQPPIATLDALAERVQAGLEENPHYRYAVGLGQLGPLDVGLLDPDGEPGWLTYERRCLSRGAKAGDLKPVSLDSWTGWAKEFARTEAAQRG